MTNLKVVIDTFHVNKGNKTKTAKDLKITRYKLDKLIEEIKETTGFDIKPYTGSKTSKIEKRTLPKANEVKYYILTSAQNNTLVHEEGFKNLLAYSKFLGNCELFVGTYSYNKSSYGPKAVKAGTFEKEDKTLWFDPLIIPYIKDENVELAPGLVWAGVMNILPTAVNPLTGVENLNGRKSNIIPHAKQYADSIAALPNEGNKFNYTTGTITLMNYIQKRAGMLAELNHHFGALLVEVDRKGNWWVRQLTIDEDDNIYDIGPKNTSGVIISEQKVSKLANNCVETIVWGDFHAQEISMLETKNMGEILDAFKPKSQFFHDVFSMSSKAKYEKDDFHSQFRKYINGEDLVEYEVIKTAKKLEQLERPFCKSYVVSSNHDDHLSYWLNYFDPKKDLKNARYFHWLQYNLLNRMNMVDDNDNILKFALKEKSPLKNTIFLERDESKIILDIEHGMHGHLGPDGSRGSTSNLARLSRKINKGHDHRAAIYKNVFSAGSCVRRMGYMSGPSSHSITHIVTYVNGSRSLVTVWDGKFRAN